MHPKLYLFLHSLIFVAMLLGGIGWWLGDKKPFELVFWLSIGTNFVVEVLERTEIITVESLNAERQPITATSVMAGFALIAFLMSFFFLPMLAFSEKYEAVPGRKIILLVLIPFCIFSVYLYLKPRDKYFEE